MELATERDITSIPKIELHVRRAARVAFLPEPDRRALEARVDAGASGDGQATAPSDSP